MTTQRRWKGIATQVLFLPLHRDGFIPTPVGVVLFVVRWRRHKWDLKLPKRHGDAPVGVVGGGVVGGVDDNDGSLDV